MVEFLVVLPALVLVLFAIIEMGAAWRSYQVVTNVAREGARIAVLHTANENQVRAAIDDRLAAGRLDPALAQVTILCPGQGASCFAAARTGNPIEVRISYPYTFLFLGPIAGYVTGGGGAGSYGTITMETGIVMRNE